MLTNQQIFDRVWQHFIVGKGKYGYNKKTERCEYKDINGHYCAIGIFMSDKQIEESQNEPINSFCFPKNIIMNIFGRPTLDPENEINSFGVFLRSLQEIHDDCAEMRERGDDQHRSEFKLSMERLAEKYSLEIPS